MSKTRLKKACLLPPFSKRTSSKSSCGKFNFNPELWHPFWQSDKHALHSCRIPFPNNGQRKFFFEPTHDIQNSTSLDVSGVERPFPRITALDNCPSATRPSEIFRELLSQSKAIHFATHTFAGDSARVFKFKNYLFHVEDPAVTTSITGEFYPKLGEAPPTETSDIDDYASVQDTFGLSLFEAAFSR